MKKEAEEWKLQRVAKAHDVLGMWQGCHNLRATKNKSRTQNHQMTVVGYISDMEEIVTPSCSLSHHDCAAAF